MRPDMPVLRIRRMTGSMSGKRERQTARLLVAAVMVLVVLVGGVWLYRLLSPSTEHSNLPGEALGKAIPEGRLSDLVWHKDHVYFFREAKMIDSTRELWRTEPGGIAEKLELSTSGCVVDYYLALAEWSTGELVLARECAEDSIEVVKVRPDNLNLERIALIQGDPVPISGIAKVGNMIIVGKDGSLCSGVARIDGDNFRPIAPLTTSGGPLDLGASFLKRNGECVDSPLGGFVTSTGGTVGFLASTAAIGTAADQRAGAKWTAYRTAADWVKAEGLADGFEEPTQMAGLGDCGLLVAAERAGSKGIWLVGWDGRTERVLDGRYADFAVQAGSGAMAVVGGDDEDSLRLIQQPFKDEPSCRVDASRSPGSLP